jgi:hypothetical protein
VEDTACPGCHGAGHLLGEDERYDAAIALWRERGVDPAPAP